MKLTIEIILKNYSRCILLFIEIKEFAIRLVKFGEYKQAGISRSVGPTDLQQPAFHLQYSKDKMKQCWHKGCIIYGKRRLSLLLYF